MYSRPDYFEQFKELTQAIGTAYFPETNYVYKLCLHDIISGAYIGSLYLLSKLYTAPIASPLLRTFSIDFFFKIKEISETDLLQYALKSARYTGKIGSILFKARKGISVLKGGTGAAGLAVSIGTPFVYQQIEDGFLGFLFHRYGRILLLLFEESQKKGKNKLPLETIF